MTIDGKTPLEFARDWYNPEQINKSINRQRGLARRDVINPIPTDVFSEEFSIWLAGEYRLAMMKGMQLAENELSIPKDHLF